MTKTMQLIAKVVPALLVAAAVSSCVYATKQESYLSGHRAGEAAGITTGRQQVIDEFQTAVDRATKAADSRAELERIKAQAYQELARRELEALGTEHTHAKQELAAYLAEKHAKAGKSIHGAADSSGSGSVDPSIVRMLNEARGQRSAGANPGSGADSAAAARADSASPLP